MPASHDTLGRALAELVGDYQSRGHFGALPQALREFAAQATPDAIVMAAEQFRDEPSVIAPLYEVVVAAQPNNARALVILANALWLLGAGPEPVQDLAARARAADPSNRGAWHLWALSEANPRDRALRWREVTESFHDDALAWANLADNAAAVASAEQDYAMLDLSIEAYEWLLAHEPTADQRAAVETALKALKGWKF